MKRYLSYNDVSILPKYSEINFKDVNLKTRLTKSLFIDTPIITRLDDVLLDINGIAINNTILSLSDLKTVEFLVENGCKVLVIDGGGYHKLAGDIIEKIKTNVPGVEVIGGPVATGEGVRYLCDKGADAIRVGNSKEQFFKSNLQTGINVPEVSSVLDAVSISDKYDVPIIANGDIKNSQDATKCLEITNADGIMIGRASIGYPWIFNEIKNFINKNKKIKKPSLHERIETVKRHLDFSIEWKGETLGLIEMRRHYTNYFRGIENFKKFRMKLIESTSYEESLETLNNVYKIYKESKVIA